jgi:hypothetical protein
MAPAFPMPGCPARHRAGTRDSSWDEERATFEPRSISVLTLGREGIAEITTFLGPGLLPLFGLPDQIEP